MQQYHNLIREILTDGVVTPNRTGVNTIKLDGAMMRFDLAKGFPAVTSKKLAFKAVVGELCAFLRAARSAAVFRELGCKVWDANANDPGKPGSPNAWLTNPYREGEDDLGPVYGAQWREWPGVKVIPVTDDDRHDAIISKLEADGWQHIGFTHMDLAGKDAKVYYKEIDQLGDCVRTIIKDPNNRRILFHGWNPAVLDEVALPACHLLYQFLPDSVNRRLNMTIYIRSNDVGLGSPFNIAEAALLVEFVARLTGMAPGRVSYMIGDAHIYANQIDYLNELLTKEPLPLPTLKISDDVPSYSDLVIGGMGTEAAVNHVVDWLKLVEPSHFELVDYQYHTLETPVPKMVV